MAASCCARCAPAATRAACGRPPWGTWTTGSSLPGPFATMRLRLTSSVTLDGDIPRSTAISRAERLLSSPRSIAARSAWSSLRYLLCLVSDMARPFSRVGPVGPRRQRGFSDLPGRVGLSLEESFLCADDLEIQTRWIRWYRASLFTDIDEMPLSVRSLKWMSMYS